MKKSTIKPMQLKRSKNQFSRNKSSGKDNRVNKESESDLTFITNVHQIALNSQNYPTETFSEINHTEYSSPSNPTPIHKEHPKSRNLALRGLSMPKKSSQAKKFKKFTNTKIQKNPQKRSTTNPNETKLKQIKQDLKRIWKELSEEGKLSFMSQKFKEHEIYNNYNLLMRRLMKGLKFEQTLTYQFKQARPMVTDKLTYNKLMKRVKSEQRRALRQRRLSSKDRDRKVRLMTAKLNKFRLILQANKPRTRAPPALGPSLDQSGLEWSLMDPSTSLSMAQSAGESKSKISQFELYQIRQQAKRRKMWLDDFIGGEDDAEKLLRMTKKKAGQILKKRQIKGVLLNRMLRRKVHGSKVDLNTSDDKLENQNQGDVGHRTDRDQNVLLMDGSRRPGTQRLDRSCQIGGNHRERKMSYNPSVLDKGGVGKPQRDSITKKKSEGTSQGSKKPPLIYRK